MVRRKKFAEVQREYETVVLDCGQYGPTYHITSESPILLNGLKR